MGLEANQSCHIVVLPYPGWGHINPILTFCKQLLFTASYSHIQIHFTIILTEEWAELIHDKPGNARIATISNVIPTEHGRGANNEGFLEAVYTRMEKPVGFVLDRIGGPKPDVIIADTFLPWAVDLGNSRNIPVASFWPMLVSPFLALHHYELLIQNGHYPLDQLIGDKGEERIDYIPLTSPTRLADFPLTLHSYKKTMLDLMLQAMSLMNKTQFIILRTLDELEGPAIGAMKLIFPTIPIYTIGPTINLPNQSSPPRDDSPIALKPDYILWLDSQPVRSVLFVSLGSHLSPSSEQLEELVVGLADSSIPYLFVGRDKTEFLKGLCGNKGFIVNWCDQMKVLYHKSIGGFLTHAGLSSTLEGVFAGVPMLTFPITTDQPMNSKLIIEDWRVGSRLRDRIEKDVLVKREKVTEVVTQFMSVETIKMNKHCKEFKEILTKAISQGSTTECNVIRFLVEVLDTHPKQ